jgi:hypothetical protein
MSGSTSNKRKSAGRGAGGTAPPATGSRSVHNVTLFLLVSVVFLVAVMMVGSFIVFVVRPDPSVKAGPMYVTLTLTTGAALLMLFLSLNASFLPFISRQRARDLGLVMLALGVTGIVTGLLTLGGAINSIVTRLVFASIAYLFIAIQDARLASARAAARAGQATPPGTQKQPRPRSRQRRGGRKH